MMSSRVEDFQVNLKLECLVLQKKLQLPFTVTIDRRTVAFVQKRLVGVTVFEEWKDGEGAPSQMREAAVDTMIDSLKRIITKPLPSRAKPQLAVRKDGSIWFVEDADA